MRSIRRILKKWANTERKYHQLKDHIKWKIGKSSYISKEKEGNGGRESIAHVTYCVATNAGDTVLSNCVRSTFENNLSLKEWEIIGVKDAVDNSSIDIINDCRMLVIGGGGLFLPDTNENNISGWQWAVSDEQLDSINVPICVFSVGYNYFPGQEPTDLFKKSLEKLVKKSAFFGLRNKGSVEAIKGLLPEDLREKVKYQPCTTTLVRYLDRSLPEKKENKTVAVNMAFDREDRRYGAAKETILKQVAEGIRRIEKKGYSIYYVCHCRADYKFVSYLKAAGVKPRVKELSKKYPKEVVSFYNEMDVVIGMRGHAQMIPFGLNCNIISLGTHDKMRWFTDDINALDWYIDMTSKPEILSDDIVHRFEEIHEINREDTERRLKEEQAKLWDVTCKNMKEIEHIFEGSNS